MTHMDSSWFCDFSDHKMFQRTYTDEEEEQIKKEFQRVKKNVYLDHTGTTLYSEKQISDVCEMLQTNLLSNPHTSKITEDLIDQVRYRVLQHFNVDANDYSIVFTSGATASLRTVAECFEFGKNGEFVYVQENHTSVLGMREVVGTSFVKVITRDELLGNATNNSTSWSSASPETEGNNLVTFSAQCNFSGFKCPLHLIDSIHENGLEDVGKYLHETPQTGTKKDALSWYVCLDAACFAATNYLDLKKYKADFVCISFYKLFGYPSGLGALLVSKRGQSVLKKKYYGGGTVKIAMSKVDFHEKRDGFHDRFEDGTKSFLGIPSLLVGFRTFERLIPPTKELSSIQRISLHTYRLGKYCYDSLKELKYSNGQKLIKFYCHSNFECHDSQGGIVAFSVFDRNGDYVGFAEIACIASIYNIQLRTGCFCNPGACQVFLGLKDDEIRHQYKAGHVCGDYNDLIDGVPTGAARVSFGYMTQKEDVDAFINMIKECYVDDKRQQEILNSKVSSRFSHVSERMRSQSRKIRLKYICIYPIKSCGAFKIHDNWELNAKGLKYDRCWLIVTSNGTALTQKNDTRMCLVSPKVNLEKGVLELSFPEMKAIEIPLETASSHKMVSSLCQSKVCGDLVEGNDCGDAVAEWLSTCLSIPGLRLIQHSEDSQRTSKSGEKKDISLSNQAQFLLINETSVKWLASKVEDWSDTDGSDVDSIVDRFRGNFIIETQNPFDENNFETLQIGSETLKFDGHCTRCQMICIDQQSGEKTVEPLRTIARQFQGKMRFGIYLSRVVKNGVCDTKIYCTDEIFFK